VIRICNKCDEEKYKEPLGLVKVGGNLKRVLITLQIDAYPI
jgi:hypothetical protein